MITHQLRCGLCGCYVRDVDREVMLEPGRWEWSEDRVDEARLDAHQCIDTDPYGARTLGRLADSEMLRPELTPWSPELDARPTVVRPELVGTIYDAAPLEQAGISTRWQAPPSAY